MITYQWHTYENFQDVRMIRTQVFHQEQGFSLENEFDETDRTALHLVAYLDGAPVGTGRIFSGDGLVWHIGRVAVLKSHRGLHLGAGMMAEMERRIRELGGTSIVLSAQCQARGFYETQGFVAQGDSYLDEHCPHIDMIKLFS